MKGVSSIELDLSVSEPIFVSVIIPTVGRQPYVSRTVADLHVQSYRNAEIIIVDQSPEPDATNYEAPSGLPVRYLRDGGKGAARSRNAGIRAARGNILLFVDDDVEISDRDFILSHVRAYDDPSVGGVCGRTIELRSDIRRRHASTSAPFVLPVLCIPSGDGSVATRGFVNSVKGGNMSFRTEIIRDIGGFDERFGFPCIYEETDVALKVCKQGHRILFSPEAMLLHIGAPSGGQRADHFKVDRRFVVYRDRALLFSNNYPIWQFPFFFLGNLVLALRPLAGLRLREAGRSCAGLLTGTRKYVFSVKPSHSSLDGPTA